MSYIPNTEADRTHMLASLGLARLDDLFIDIPAKLRFPALALESAKSELEVESAAARLAQANRSTSRLLTFVGAGAYDHHIPSVVPALASRGEFATSYTPYQPEVSQGTLQAIFEYQSLVAELIGADVVNASHYDGATALAEAILMSFRVSRNKRKRVVFAAGIHPEYQSVARTYLQAVDGVDLDFCADEAENLFQNGPAGNADAGPLERAAAVDDATACFVMSFPDFFGRLCDIRAISERVHANGALLVVNVNPIAAGLFRSPGSCGADIITGEGQPLGLPLSFGGPYLGIFGCTKELVRRTPGRLAGETVDHDGRRGYVLTLNTREQHIRREKATSNICTNQGLMALRAAIYLAALGPRGLREVAEICYQRAHYAATEIGKLAGYSIAGSAPFFHEFVVRCPKPARDVVGFAESHGVIPGFDLGRYYDGLSDCLLVCATEKRSRDDIDSLCRVLSEAAT